MCFYLDENFTEQEGQIAHLDHDPSNGDEDNLVYLCLKHHSLYDSRTSQHKNYTLPEIKAARSRLYEAVAQYKPCEWVLVLDGTFSEFDRTRVEGIVEHLRKTLGDPHLTIKRLERGSIRLFIGSSEHAFERMTALLKEEGEPDGQSLLGYHVEEVWRRLPNYVEAIRPSREEARPRTSDFPKSSGLLADLVGLRGWMAIRVAFNAWLDARASLPGGRGSPQPFEDAIRADMEARSLAIQNKTMQEIAARRGEGQLATIYGPEYERMKEITGRHASLVGLSTLAHLILVGLLVIGEVAFNLSIFSVVAEPALYAWVMALTVAISIPVCAYSIGVWLRRWHGPWIYTAIRVGSAILIVLTALLGVSRVLEAMKIVVNIPLVGSAFLSVNILLFLTLALLNYMSHDPVEGFAEAKESVERLRRGASVLQSRIAVLEQRLQGDTRRERERERYYAALYRTVYQRHGGTAYDLGGETNITPDRSEADRSLRDD
jgi:hypothetical protein